MVDSHGEHGIAPLLFEYAGKTKRDRGGKERTRERQRGGEVERGEREIGLKAREIEGDHKANGHVLRRWK